MARPRAYDPDAVLNAAVQAFWKCGYEGTSIRDLVDACGLTTRSMYDAFGDKEQFFEAAMDRYHEQVLAPVLQLLGQGRGIAALEKFANLLCEVGTPDGCLYVNTGAERNLVSAAAIKRVERYLKRLRLLIRDKLEQAREDGDFHGDSEGRASQFCVSVNGFMMSLKCGLSREQSSAGLRLLVKDIKRD